MSEVKKTITAVTKATGALSKISIELQKQMSALGGFSETVHILAEDIEYKQQELSAVEQEISDAKRKANAELKLLILEDEDTIVKNILDNRGLTAIDTDELSTLRIDLTTAQYDNEDAINSAVAAQADKGKRELEAALTSAKLGHEVSTANDTATITMLRTQLADAREANTELKQMLNEEREARVSIAKAGTNINVTAPNK